MANESLIQIPPNVAEPIVLQRVLLRVVEQIDLITGARGADGLQSQVNELKKEVEELKAQLNE